MRRMIFWGLTLFAVFWAGAFSHFLHSIPRVAVGDSVSTDAIVVLTGGSLRIAYGFELLEKDKAKRLFISGVSNDLDVQQLMQVHGSSAALRREVMKTNAVELDHKANSTRSNAEQTAAWVKKENIRSIRLVTGNYHLPRSLLEFRRSMPGLILVPDPVFPENFTLDHWWSDSISRELILSEFHKYLVVWLLPGLVT